MFPSLLIANGAKGGGFMKCKTYTILSGIELPQDLFSAVSMSSPIHFENNPLYALIFDSINMSNRETEFSFDQNPIP